MYFFRSISVPFLFHFHSITVPVLKTVPVRISVSVPITVLVPITVPVPITIPVPITVPITHPITVIFSLYIFRARSNFRSCSNFRSLLVPVPFPVLYSFWFLFQLSFLFTFLLPFCFFFLFQFPFSFKFLFQNSFHSSSDLRKNRKGMKNCEWCGARNQCTENGSDVYQPTLDAPLTIAGETLKCVDSFTYLRSVISNDRIAQKDIRTD